MTNFVNVLSEMKEHYQNNINNGVALPYYPNLVEDSLGLMEATNKYLVADDSELADNSVQSKLNDLQNQAKDLSTNTASTIEEELKKSAKELKDSGNSDSSQSKFKDKLNKIKEDAKKKANDNIEKIFAEAEKIGNTFPVAQNLIIVAAQKISDLINDLFTRLVDYIVKIVSDIIVWIKGAWDSIVSTFNNIKTWILNWFK
ncbi:YtxH domain-containing protein [Acinetobacter pittii]|uniref:YtxH domain-containing protein n=1 Tax=Acinetobacter pittii TaxID=48296 RepID=UPI0008389B88|nr:YtxH domain-containing protein [Acinetobacter pittii]MCK0870743.1 YtxH domain-containing protein [Acinetobacter pittii]MCK0921618.1 YtxH domain-containing protein [Acinetobacter pittii]